MSRHTYIHRDIKGRNTREIKRHDLNWGTKVQHTITFKPVEARQDVSHMVTEVEDLTSHTVSGSFVCVKDNREADVVHLECCCSNALTDVLCTTEKIVVAMPPFQGTVDKDLHVNLLKR